MHKRLGLSAFASPRPDGRDGRSGRLQPGFYVGAGIGTTEIAEDSIDEFNADDSDTGFKVFGGYSFNENFAVEASYFDLGEASGAIEDFPSFGDVRLRGRRLRPERFGGRTDAGQPTVRAVRQGRLRVV